ncbi:MAG: hypothetical protein ABI682_05485, partial [Acidobacteriota bacterium]
MTRTPDAPCEYRDDTYYAEVVRRAGVLNGMNQDEVRREREECLKRGGARCKGSRGCSPGLLGGKLLV